MVQQSIQTIATAVFVLFAGPIAGAITPEWWYGLGTCLAGLCFILAVFFVPETKYDRPASSFQEAESDDTATSEDGKTLTVCTERPELDFVNFEPRTWKSDLRLWIGKPEWNKLSEILLVSISFSPRYMWLTMINSKPLGFSSSLMFSGLCASTVSPSESTSLLERPTEPS